MNRPEPDPVFERLFTSPPTDKSPQLADAIEEVIRRRCIRYEKSIKFIGGTYIVGATLTALILVVACAAAVQAGAASPSQETIFFVMLTIALTLAYGVTGLGLMRLRAGVRVPGLLLAIICLFYVPVGTVLGAFSIYLLTNKKEQYVFNPKYQRVIAETPHIRLKTTSGVIGLLFVLIAVIVLFILGGVLDASLIR